MSPIVDTARHVGSRRHDEPPIWPDLAWLLALVVTALAWARSCGAL